ncbi:MAG: hypothetical protein ACI4XS_05710, partial [Bacillus sp. (in: firmicutes)]
KINIRWKREHHLSLEFSPSLGKYLFYFSISISLAQYMHDSGVDTKLIEVGIRIFDHLAEGW